LQSVKGGIIVVGGRWYLEFKAVMVIPAITRNCSNYPYGNYVGTAPVGMVYN